MADTPAVPAEQPTRAPAVRGALFAAAMLAAWCVFALALLSPLTPSEGRTPWYTVLVWVGTPLGLLALVVRHARHSVVRSLAAIQLLAILTLAAWALSSQY
jgi:hypothetical protein